MGGQSKYIYDGRAAYKAKMEKMVRKLSKEEVLALYAHVSRREWMEVNLGAWGAEAEMYMQTLLLMRMRKLKDT